MHKLVILIEIKHKQKAFWPSDSILTNLYYKINILTHENENTRIVVALLFIVTKNWKQLECPSVEDGEEIMAHSCHRIL